MGPKTKLAQLIGLEEGFGKPGAIPTTHHNPGDLRHSPHSEHPTDPNAIGVIDTDEHGWEDLESQLEKYAARGLTLAEMVAIYAPPSENSTNNYLHFITSGLSLPPSTPVSTALKVPANA
jgi:hypothetical protein